MFRIIAVRLFDSCKRHIVRVLQKDTTYFFYRDYTDDIDVSGNWLGIKRLESNPFVRSHFYNGLNSSDAPIISLSAIVGRNGDGKSSLIEFIIRVINNFAVKAGFRDDQETLGLADGVSGIIFYEIKGQLHSISYKEGEAQVDGESVRGDKQSLGLDARMFYTIVNNYSIYAYNSLLFENESESGTSWINGVFHKNDSYQTPIVLNPMRTKGVMDVNRERHLCRQRLMSMYSDDCGFSGGRVINGDKKAEGFAFRLVSESKLTISLMECFKSIWASRTISRFYRNHEEYLQRKGAGEAINDNYYLEDDFIGQRKFFSKYDARIIKKYSGLFKTASLVHRNIRRDMGMPMPEGDPEVKRYLSSFKFVAKDYIKDKNELSRLLKTIEALEVVCEDLNALELQRVCLIISICEKWSRDPLFGENGHLYDNVFDDSTYLAEERKQALMYLAYKTLEIFKQYKPFVDWIDVDSRAFLLFEYPLEGQQDIYHRLGDCFNALFENDEHRIKESFDTLKLRQTVNFLRHDKYAMNSMNGIPKGLGNVEYTHYLSFDSLSRITSQLKSEFSESTISLLPPPIYEGDIIVNETKPSGTGSLFPMSELSSGELQMLNSIGTFTYHLRNLDYEQDVKNMIQYKYVNLVLEEVELYFHPEYQRQYVYRLLEQISQIRFQRIKGINIMVVTHSPFVLSDIPRRNILYLKNGTPKNVCMTPFAANIGDTLKDSFFLEDGFMGEYSRYLIASLVMFLLPDEKEYFKGVLDKGKIDAISMNWDVATANSFINEIGDPLVKKSLEELLGEYKPR